jgi:mRNA-degrading endonuclease toxin of MazEF toxin-antitoxin module
MCEQVRTVEVERLDREPVAQCPPEVMEQVDEALRYSLGLLV